MSIIQGTAKSGGSTDFYDYPIEDSLRFDGSSYLSKSANASANENRYTVSFWFKSSKIDHIHKLFSFGTPGNESALYIDANNKVELSGYVSAYTWQVLTKNILRDTSAYYHLVFVLDRTNVTAKVYINGVEAEYEINDPPTSTDNLFTRSASYIGNMYGQSYYTNGYLANIQFIDGQALDASYFGETKQDIWVPKAYTGSYGTNGFHLDFADSSNIGNDVSGNNNDWTVN